MLGGNLAVIILGCLALVLALIIPVLNSFEKLSNFISLRWSCVAIILLIMVGVVIDFNHLADDTRNIVLTGGLIVVSVFIVIRTVEKILYNGWLRGVNLKGSIQKGDIVASGEINTDNMVKHEALDTDQNKEKEKEEQHQDVCVDASCEESEEKK